MAISELTFKPLGAHNSGLDISTAQTLAPPSGAMLLCIQTINQNVRLTTDGSTPTTTHGFQLKAANTPTIFPIAASTVIKVIQESATAQLQFQWGGYV